MKFFIVVFIFGLAGLPAWAQPSAQPDAEMFVGALMIGADGSQYSDPFRCADVIEQIRRLPFSRLIIQVRVYGDAYYESELVPKAWTVVQNFDPLGEFVKAFADDPDREVYAWITPLRVVNLNRAIPIAENHVTRAHPEWLSRDARFLAEDEGGFEYLEPGLDEVQEHLESVAAELATRYDLDGIVFEGMRYPGASADWGYHPTMLQRWRERSGLSGQPEPRDEIWAQMRREAMTRCLDRMARAAKKARPGIETAAIVLGDGPAPESPEAFSQTIAYSGALQDWARWMKDQTVDFLILENFHREGESSDQFDAWNDFSAAMVRTHGVEIIPTIAGFNNISIDALAQFGRVHKSGLLGAALDNFRDPIQDISARELFFRVLSQRILGPGSRRRPFPPARVIASAAPTPVPFPPGPSDAGNPAPDQLPPPPPVATVETVHGATLSPAQSRSKLEELIDKAPRQTQPNTAKHLIEPTQEAINTLRRRFPNIY